MTEVRLEELQLAVRSNWTRRTRLVRLAGPDATGAVLHGAGEDVSWNEVEEAEVFALYPRDLLCFRGSLAEWCARLDAREATPAYQMLARARRSEADYLRWALESAAMELALRQQRQCLSTLLDRTPKPLRFCLSMGLGEPPSTSTLQAWLKHGAYTFKLDAASSWSEPLISELRATGAVAVVDLKAYYHDTPVDQPVDPALYQRVRDGLPDALIEDALPDDSTRALLQPAAARLSWDAPIHAVEDVARVVPAAWGTPRWMNIKPSRFGSWQKLLAMYEWAEREAVQLYGGGQFELGIGRQHAQALASLFHPEAANDLAPIAFHQAKPQAGLAVDTVQASELNQTAWLAVPDRPD